jgi:Trk K+ transport system NAD-binding subunit
VPAITLALFVLIGNPLIVLAIMGAMGYRKRTGFLAGLTVAQISEFSLLFMAMGLALGHVDDRAVGLVTVVGLVTIAASVYMIMYSHTLYGWLAPVLSPFERAVPVRETVSDDGPEGKTFDVIVFGLGRYGGAIVQLLRERGMRILGADFSPAAVRWWRSQGTEVVFGDIGDAEFVASLPLEGVQWVVCAIPEHDLGLVHTDPRLGLLQILRAEGYRGRVAVAANRESSVEVLREAGAEIVFVPFVDAARQAVDLLMGEHPAERVEIIEPEGQKELAE